MAVMDEATGRVRHLNFAQRRIYRNQETPPIQKCRLVPFEAHPMKAGRTHKDAVWVEPSQTFWTESKAKAHQEGVSILAFSRLFQRAPASRRGLLRNTLRLALSRQRKGQLAR